MQWEGFLMVSYSNVGRSAMSNPSADLVTADQIDVSDELETLWAVTISMLEIVGEFGDEYWIQAQFV